MNASKSKLAKNLIFGRIAYEAICKCPSTRSWNRQKCPGFRHSRLYSLAEVNAAFGKVNLSLNDRNRRCLMDSFKIDDERFPPDLLFTAFTTWLPVEQLNQLVCHRPTRKFPKPQCTAPIFTLLISVV